jgi:oligopeptidase B
VWGTEVDDPWAWLIDPDDPATLPHLEAENAWTETVTAPLAPLRDAVFEEIRRRTDETDLSVPVRDGSWWYLVRTEEGLAYPIHCRCPDDGTTEHWVEDPAVEQVVLDLNVLAEGHDHLGLGVLDVSPDGNWLAYAVDHEGDERHDLRFADLRPLAQGRPMQDAGEVITGVAYGFAWAADSATCWYTLQDDAFRPDRVLRHVVGTDPEGDVEVFHEPDERFHVGVGASRSGTLAVISAGSAVTSESWLLDATEPTAEPRVVAAREQGVEYSVAHHGTTLFVLSNHDGADDFALWRAPLAGLDVAPRSDWAEVIPHRPGRRLDGVEAFAHHLVVHGRTDASTALWLMDPSTGDSKPIDADDPVGTLGPSANPTFDTRRYRFAYQSLTTPSTLYELDTTTGSRALLKRQPVLDGFDPERYESARDWAVADDGTRVPISLVWRPDRLDPGDGRPRACSTATAPTRCQHGPVVLHRPPLAAGPRGGVRHRPRARRRRAGSPLVRGRQVRRQGTTPSTTSWRAPATWWTPVVPHPTASRPAAAVRAVCSWGRWPTWRPSCSGRSWPRCRSWTR